jgi:hypothetical protein
MTYEVIRTRDGVMGLVDTTGKNYPRCTCGGLSTHGCDWNGCEAQLCDFCRVPFGPDLDLCPRHERIRVELSNEGQTEGTNDGTRDSGRGAGPGDAA